MHNAYRDIMALASGQRPLWWDQNGVPRFCPHHPDACPDIYANEVCLLDIACQACGTRFKVQMSWSSMRWISDTRGQARLKELHAEGAGTLPYVLAEAITEKSIHYGDPPNIDCCPGGATMNCDDLRVLEYWRREKLDWVRMPELEIDLLEIDIEETNT